MSKTITYTANVNKDINNEEFPYTFYLQLKFSNPLSSAAKVSKVTVKICIQAFWYGEYGASASLEQLWLSITEASSYFGTPATAYYPDELWFCGREVYESGGEDDSTAIYECDVSVFPGTERLDPQFQKQTTNGYTKIQFTTDGGTQRIKWIQLIVTYDDEKTFGYYDGSKWIDCIPYYFNGTKWNQCEPYYYDGESWIEISTS